MRREKTQGNWSIIPTGDQRPGIPRAPENDSDYSRNRCPEPENQRPATKCESAKVDNLSGSIGEEGLGKGPRSLREEIAGGLQRVRREDSVGFLCLREKRRGTQNSESRAGVGGEWKASRW